MSKSKYIGRYEEYGDPENIKNKYILDTATGNLYLAKKGLWELTISFDENYQEDGEKPKDNWKKYRKSESKDRTAK